MPELFEIRQLRQRLRADFTGRLPEATRGTPPEREANFLSRALAAFAVHRLAGCSLDEAARSVVDGGGDGGIDAVHHAPNSQTLWVVQSKFLSDGRGEPDLGGVAKFTRGLENLLQCKFEAFAANAAWQAVIPRLNAVFEDIVQVRGIVVYSGLEVVSDDRLQLFADVARRFSEAQEDYLVFDHFGLTAVHDWVTGADESPGVEYAEILVQRPGRVMEPYGMVYGLVRMEDIVALYRTHGERLIAANIRAYKGTTEVNENIASTLREHLDHFIYFNNGLTAYCSRLEVSNRDRGNPDQKLIRVFGLSIVNGAQTLGTIASHFAGAGLGPPGGFVFLKVISLAGCVDEEDFARRITQSTNLQNQIGQRDFVALDPEQERIARHLLPEGVHYHYKDGLNAALADDLNFGIREAALALASLEWEREGDLCATATADPEALLSFEEVYGEAEPVRTRYHRLFRPERSAREVWRAVQTRRVVVARMEAEGAGAADRTLSSFYENARAVVVNMVFVRIHPERADETSLSPDEVNAIETNTLEIARALWSACEEAGYVGRGHGERDNCVYGQPRHLRLLFSDAAECRRLRGATLARLACSDGDPRSTAAPGQA